MMTESEEKEIMGRLHTLEEKVSGLQKHVAWLRNILDAQAKAAGILLKAELLRVNSPCGCPAGDTGPAGEAGIGPCSTETQND